MTDALTHTTASGPADASRAGDFTAQAHWYAQARPGYPPELIAQLMAQTGTVAGATVLDIGAGTGISSRELAAAGLEVIAVEPNAAMRAAAGAAASWRWQVGSFEATGLPDAAADWAVGAQAFHWADVPRSLEEMRRVLRPDRWFTVFWNDRETASSPLLTATLATIREFVPGYEERYRERDWSAELTATGDFAGVQTLELTHTVAMTRARFMNLWRSHNRLNATAGPDRFARLLVALEELLAGFPAALEVPYRCRAWSVQRQP
jgi:SAM-dependent methyltransferase